MIFILIKLPNQFPPNVKLASPGSRICNPSSERGRLITSQLAKCIFCWPPLPPLQRKSLNNFDIWPEIDLGASNKIDWNMGYVVRTDLIKINFPALVSHCPPQKAILAFKFSNTSSHKEGGDEPRVKGSPKYFIFSHLTKPGNPKKSYIRRITGGSTFHPYTSLFDLLINAPEIWQNLLRITRKEQEIFIEAPPSRRESSVKKT